jgi:hypothetical protein
MITRRQKKKALRNCAAHASEVNLAIGEGAHFECLKMAKMERGLTLEGLRGNVPAEKLEPAGDVARAVVPEEDDTYKVLSPRYKPAKKRNKSKEDRKSKRRRNSGGGGPLADEEFTQPASSQTKHADVKKDEAAAQEDQSSRAHHSTPIDAVVRFLITSHILLSNYYIRSI